MKARKKNTGYFTKLKRYTKDKMVKYILTGGPGVGKTTLIERLAKMDYHIIPEVARQVIREQLYEEEKRADKNYKGILPWTNLEKFQELVIERQLVYEQYYDYLLINVKDAFLDRSVIDNIAYSEIGNVTINRDMNRLIKSRDYHTVFYLENIAAFKTDYERRETKTEAKILHEKLLEVYQRYELNIIKVPAMSIEDRLELILNEIRKK